MTYYYAIITLGGIACLMLAVGITRMVLLNIQESIEEQNEQVGDTLLIGGFSQNKADEIYLTTNQGLFVTTNDGFTWYQVANDIHRERILVRDSLLEADLNIYLLANLS